ncbi:MAG: 16S rRNA (uracil(1498)-N(3))-methyltransferase [Pseudomonadota bacterium]
MKSRRLWVADGPVGDHWQLAADRAHYLHRVLRLRSGDEITVFDGRGQRWRAAVGAGPARELKLLETLPAAAPPVLDTLLIQAVGRGERMDYALQKATELGATQLAPVLTERTQVRLSADRAARRLKHWQGVVIQACEQSGRSFVPHVHPLQPLASAWALADRSFEVRLVLAPDGQPLGAEPGLARQVALAVGPEGGFTEAELEQAKAHGYSVTRLGPRVLRTETAGPAALAAVQTLWGDFRT